MLSRYQYVLALCISTAHDRAHDKTNPPSDTNSAKQDYCFTLYWDFGVILKYLEF